MAGAQLHQNVSSCSNPKMIEDEIEKFKQTNSEVLNRLYNKMHPKGLSGKCPVKNIIHDHQEKVIEDVQQKSAVIGKRL